MTEPVATTEMDWACDVCNVQVRFTRELRIGESAADQTAANSNDLDAVRKRHKHEPNGE